MTEEQFQLRKPGEIRTRIAPSPTGFLHMGLARTALFNYLFAKQKEGVFILRIEDTDLERSKPEFEKDIMENLKWLGLEWDEGPALISQGEIGKLSISNFQFSKKYMGDYGPYRQSERSDIYAKYLKKLLDENKAYYCFCSEEELEAQRQEQMSRGEAPKYPGKCASLDKETIKKYLAEGKSPVIRLRTTAKKLTFNDLIRGKLEFDTGLMGDMVIAKNINYPLYNFAVVIDDYEMKISHVIRGEDHISNTPKQILIQEALGLPQPQYAHLPLILGPDRSKLSKRHGAASVKDYKKEGYLAESLVNFMAFLGWNPGDENKEGIREREIYSLPSLIKEFSLEKIQKAGAIFNLQRLDFLNGFYIRQKSKEKLTEICLPYLIEAGFIEKIRETVKGLDLPENSKGTEKIKIFEEEKKPEYRIKETGEEISIETLGEIILIYQERLKKLSEITELADFFFKDPSAAKGKEENKAFFAYDINLLRWKEMTDKEIKEVLEKLEKILSKMKGKWDKKNIESVLMAEAEKAGSMRQAGDRGYILWPFRAALTGKKASAGPFEIAEILGKEKTLKRIKDALNKIKNEK